MSDAENVCAVGIAIVEDEAMQTGAFRFVKKPASLKDILEAVTAATSNM